MKTFFKNVQLTTADFNLAGKILTWSVLTLIFCFSVTLLAGIVIEIAQGRNINFSY